MTLSQAELKDALDNSPSPNRVTEEYMKSRIQTVNYYGPELFNGTMTLCIIVLDNGFQVQGSSACADPLNYKKDIGESYAYERAFKELWPLFGFLLKEKMYLDSIVGIQHSHIAIARVCHQTNKALCEAAGDYSQKDWDQAEPWQRDSAMAGVKWRLENMDAPYSAQHEAWMADKVKDGWVYGKVKDPVAKAHPCLVAYDLLPFEQKVKDYTFVAIVKSMVS